MQRFLRVFSLSLLAVAVFIGYKAAAMPWAPRIDWDILGLLWLLDNLGKMAAWVFACCFGVLGVICLLAARRIPERHEDLASEDQRLLGYLLVNPARRRPPGGISPEEPPQGP